MKTTLVTAVATMALLAALVIPSGLAAQQPPTQEKTPGHRHYQLFDLGTLGGPAAYKSVNAPGYQIINNAGVIAFAADTAMSDPFAPNCFNADCFVSHALRWQNGMLSDLGALPGSGNSSASGAINPRGDIVGQSENGEIDPISGLPEVRATFWNGDQITDLGTFGGNWSVGITLNDAEDVVGFASNTITDPYSLFPPAGTQSRAFLWRNGILQDLGTLGGPDAQALSVNERGHVAGISYTNSFPNQATGIPTVHPFLWRDGKMTDLGTLGGTYAGSGSCAFGAPLCNGPVDEGALLVNNHGQVIGTSNLLGDQSYHPFLWDHGTMTDLGTLGGNNGTAVWITDSGAIVGQADLPPNPPGCSGLTCIHHAFLWNRGVMTDLGTLWTDPCSRALMTNSNKQIVGTTIAVCGQLSTHPFLWENGGPMVDVNTLISGGSGAVLYEADNINERGEIVASGLPAGCNDRFACGHVYLLIPCDEHHPGIKGCDYSLVETANGTRTKTLQEIQDSGASQHVGLRSRLRGPYWPRPNSIQTSPALAVNPRTSVCAERDDNNPPFGRHGYCLVSSGRLTGYCFSNPYCQHGRSPTCPQGLPVLRPGYEPCLGFGLVEVDTARPCSF